MRQIVGFEVIGIDTEPLAAEHVLRAQQFCGRGILDDAADLLPGEFGDGVVGRLFEQQVAVGAEKGEPAALPRRLVLLPALLRVRLQRRLHIEREIEAGRTRARLRAQLRIMRLGFLQIIFRQRLVPAGTDQVAVRWNTVSCDACCAMIGIDWIADEPVPMTPTRRPVKSTPSCGHSPV